MPPMPIATTMVIIAIFATLLRRLTMASNVKVERPRANACRAVDRSNSFHVHIARLALYPSRSAPMMGWTPPDLFSASYVPAGLMWCRSQRNPEGVRHECYDRCGGFGKERVRSRCRRSELESD